jgi:hypothetical protein
MQREDELAPMPRAYPFILAAAYEQFEMSIVGVDYE